jgi:hypothetical protein
MGWSKKARSSCLSFNNAAKGVLQQRFRQCRIVREVGERDLRLDHPELGEMAAGVRVLAEGRSEGVDLGQCEAVGLDIELPRDRQERLAAEEILREIDLALGSERQVGKVQACRTVRVVRT